MARDEVPGRPAIVTGWMAVVGILSMLALIVIVIWMARPSGLLAAVVVGVAMVVAFVAWFVSWTALTTRVQRSLMARPELDEPRRVAWFSAVLLGYPVLSVAVLVLLYGVARTLAT